MADKSPQNVVAGCLGRSFTLFGLFFLFSTLFAVIREFDGSSLDIGAAGAFIPALIFLTLGRVLKRGAGSSTSETDSVAPKPIPPRPIPPRPIPPTEMNAPRRQVRENPEPVVPELPVVESMHEPMYEPGELPALEALEMDDFRPNKPMSSEERIRRAREKYNKKH